MPAIFSPLAGIAVRYAAFALAGYALAKGLPKGEPDARAEAAMNDLPDGLGVSSDDGAARASGRLRRSFRLGAQGVKIDAGFLARLKVSRL